LAVFERRAGDRLAVLRSEERYNTAEDRAWQAHLAELRDVARMAREVVHPEET
jgi:hypothetical protein